MSHHELIARFKDLPRTPRYPVLFVGHGSPMNGIEDNRYSSGWERLGGILPRPRAVLAVSAHWLTEGTRVHAGDRPRTIYDFYGFPEELYRVEYPAPGAPDIANALARDFREPKIDLDRTWGLDHGTWVVARRLFPRADVPMLQLSLDATRGHASHYEIGRSLSLLRERGVLILGSGNIVHNLRMIDFANTEGAYDWARTFDERVKDSILRREHGALIDLERWGSEGALSVPTPEHYWPLLTVLGASAPDDGISFPIEGLTMGSISMRAILIGELPSTAGAASS